MSISNILKKTYKSIPLKWYFDFNHYLRELSKIWSHEWIYACHSDTLKNPLDFITLEVSKFHIILLKNTDNQIIAYLNTCSHRGSLLIDKTKGKLKNNILICPYHQWSYNASNGKLLKTSSFKKPRNFNYLDYGLKKITIKIWNGLIFLNFDSNIPWKIKDRFQDYDSIINKLNVEKFVVGYKWSKIINCNWKIFWENYSECLHCPNIHPDLSKLVPIYSRRLVDIKDDPDWKKLLKNKHPKYQGGLREGAETWSNNGSAQGNYINEIKKLKNFSGHIYITNWPSMFLAIFIDHIRVVRIIPKNNEQTEVTAEWLFETQTNDNLNYNKNNVIDFAIKVMEEDGKACELNQKGLYNTSIKNGVLMPEEYDIKRFHDWLRKKLI